MSTRCQIGVYESDDDVKTNADIRARTGGVLLYRHSDGYPGSLKKDDIGVVPDILPFLKEFHKVRGHDTAYLRACLMAYLKQYHCGDKVVDNIHLQTNTVAVNGITISALSHGIDSEFHLDIEYYYAITPTRLIVYRVNGGWEDKHEFKKIKEYSLKEKVKA